MRIAVAFTDCVFVAALHIGFPYIILCYWLLGVVVLSDGWTLLAASPPLDGLILLWI